MGENMSGFEIAIFQNLCMPSLVILQYPMKSSNKINKFQLTSCKY